MNRNSFWLVLGVSFISAGISVLVFAFLVDNQIGELKSQISSLEGVVEKYGVEDEVEQESIQSDSVSDLTLNQVKNASYNLNLLGSDLEEFRLVNGDYVNQSDNNLQQVYIDLTKGEEHEGVDYLFVNLDDDQEKEALVVLNYTDGGTGVFKYLALLENEDGSATNIDSISLTSGLVNSLSYDQEEGIISVDMTVHGEGDFNCCPSQEETKYYKLQNNKITETNE